MPFALNTDEEEGEISKTPVKYVPLCEVYSATAPCVSASGSSMSKKVTARKLPNFDHQDDGKPSGDVMGKPPVTHVYSRRRNPYSPQKPSIFDDLTVKSVVVKTEVEEGEGGGDWRKRKRRKMGLVRFRMRDFAQALKDCDEALKIEDTHFKTLLCKGKILLNLNRYSMALQCSKPAILDPHANVNFETLHGFLQKCKKMESLSKTELAEYIGAMEIKKSKFSGRGLFAEYLLLMQ